MTYAEMLDKLREDKSVYRNFLILRKMYTKVKEDESLGVGTSVLVENYLSLGELMIMIKLSVPIETVQELLTVPLDGISPIEIKDPYAAFMQLCSEYDSSREFAKRAGVTESWLSLHRNRKRRMTVDKVIALCKKVGRSYTVG